MRNKNVALSMLLGACLMLVIAAEGTITTMPRLTVNGPVTLGQRSGNAVTVTGTATFAETATFTTGTSATAATITTATITTANTTTENVTTSNTTTANDTTANIGTLAVTGNSTIGDATTDTITMTGLVSSFKVAGANKTAAYTMTATDDVVFCATTDAVTITLPDIADLANGKIFIIAKSGGGSNACTVAPDSGDFVNGVAGNYSAIDASGDSIILYNTGITGAEWQIVGSHIN